MILTDDPDDEVRAALALVGDDPAAPARTVVALAERRARQQRVGGALVALATSGALAAGFAFAFFQPNGGDVASLLDGTAFILGGLM